MASTGTYRSICSSYQHQVHSALPHACVLGVHLDAKNREVLCALLRDRRPIPSLCRHGYVWVRARAHTDPWTPSALPSGAWRRRGSLRRHPEARSIHICWPGRAGGYCTRVRAHTLLCTCMLLTWRRDARDARRRTRQVHCGLVTGRLLQRWIGDGRLNAHDVCGQRLNRVAVQLNLPQPPARTLPLSKAASLPAYVRELALGPLRAVT